uniref:Uncharacterized protein n=1 Tax=Sciurus vulgaris TaxID=55149 RepID=A0A8D2DML2_SCIVU
MTKALALDESQYGLGVNCVSPGNIWTLLWEQLATSIPDPRATIQEGNLAQGGPLGHMGQPAEFVALFLASEANFCTGIEVLVTGGAELGYGCKAARGNPWTSLYNGLGTRFENTAKMRFWCNCNADAGI